MDYWQKISELLNISEPVNGSWIQAIVEKIVEDNEIENFELVNGSWIESLSFLAAGGGSVNGSWIQTIVENFKVEEPVNGSWIQALYEILVDQNN
jgi:predicted small secreted protein